MFKVEKFSYNGFAVQGFGTETDYTAEFVSWTQDPGIALCRCSDGKEREIPSCCLIGDTSILPVQTFTNKIIFGKPTTHETEIQEEEKVMAFAFAAGEFLEEELDDLEEKITKDHEFFTKGEYRNNKDNKNHPHEWWTTQAAWMLLTP